MKKKFSTQLWSLILSLSFLFCAPASRAMKTVSSFDINYAYTNFTFTSTNNTSGAIDAKKSLTSNSGYEIDYNVALLEAKTVISFSFLQFLSSNLGPIPYSRMGVTFAYHFIRMNGQRFILDNGVEGKTWGVSPALELSLGFSKLSIKDPTDPRLNFTSSSYDMIPRILFEIPLSPNFLIMLRAGLISSLGFGQNKSDTYSTTYGGAIYTVGFKLTTL